MCLSFIKIIVLVSSCNYLDLLIGLLIYRGACFIYLFLTVLVSSKAAAALKKL